MSILAPILNSFLHQYIKGIDEKQANFDLTKSNVTLHDFSFTSNLFTNFGIPLVIKNSNIGNAIINLNIISINKVAMLQLNNVDIYAVVDFTQAKEDNNLSIDKLIQSIENDKKPTLLEKKKSWYGWFERIIDNAKIEIKNVRLHIEFEGLDDTTNSITLYLESLEMNTIDANNKPSIFDQKPTTLIKKIELTNFSIAIHNDITSIQNFEELNGMNYNVLKNGSFSFILKNTDRRNSSFFNIFEVVFRPINFKLNENQYLALRHLFKEYLTSKLFQKFHISQKLKSENQADWNYFNYLSNKKSCPHKLSPCFALQFLKKRKKFYENFNKKIKLLTPMKKIIKDSLEENGKDLTYCFLLYTSILVRFEKSDKKSIIDLLFSFQNSIDFQIKFPKISIDIENLFSFSTENIIFIFKQLNKDYNVELNVNDCLITDFHSKSYIIQKVEDLDNFIHFRYNSKEQTKVVDICKFKFDLQSSFVTRFSQFFFNVNKNNADNNYLNQCLLMLNPLFLQKFKLESKGFLVNYTINNTNNSNDDDDSVMHLFNCDIKKFELQSNPENLNNEADQNQLDIFSEFECGQIKVDDSIISNELKIQCSKRRIVDNYNISIFDAEINIDSKIVEITKNILSSITNSTQIDFNKVYSLNSIIVNCSELLFNINTGKENLALSISTINVDPYVEFKDVSIQKADKNKIISIPSLCFNEWPTITTESFRIKLNSLGFLKFSEDFNWMANQIKTLSSSFVNLTYSKVDNDDDDDIEDQISSENNNQILNEQHKFVQFKANEINCEIEDKKEKMQFKNSIFIFDEKTVIKSGLFNLLSALNKKLIFCDEEINISRETTETKNAILIDFPNLIVDSTWTEFSEIADYFKYFCKNNENEKLSSDDSNKFADEVCLKIQKSTLKIDDTFLIQSKESRIKFLISENPSLIFEFPEFNIDELIKINNLSIKINGFVYDVSISSMDVVLPQLKISEISSFNYIMKILNIPNDQGSQIDINLNIENLKILDLSNELEVILSNVKFSLNSYHSIGAIKIQSIQLENLILNDAKVLLIFNSSDFKPESIDSIFSLEKKKVENLTKLSLTSIQTDIDSIEFNYSHDIIMILLSFYENSYIIKCPISAKVNKLIVKSNDIQDNFIFSKVTFEKVENSKELKCNSIDYNNFIQKRNENHQDSNLLVIRKEGSNLSVEINKTDFYFDINVLKFVTNVYNSLVKINNNNDDDENQNDEDNSSFVINFNDTQVHLPFTDDPLCKKHDLIVRFDLLIDIKKNFSKSIKMTNLTSFFNNYKKGIHFLPLFKDISFSFKLENNKTEQKNFDYSLFEFETSNIEIYLTAIDILELQIVLDNFKQSIKSLFDEQIRSFIEKRKKGLFPFTFFTSHVILSPITISLCEDNRDSNQYYPVMTLRIQNTNQDESKIFYLIEDSMNFSMNFIISMKNMNYLNGKTEILIPPTPFIVAYSDYNNISFGISFLKGIDFNLTHSSLLTLIRFEDKFKKKDQTLLFKYEAKFNYKPKYYVRNNLSKSIHVKYKQNSNKKDINFDFEPGELIPLVEINEDCQLKFNYKETSGIFCLKELTIPIYFDKVSVSIVQKNLMKTIMFNSPLSIQNKLDFNLYIYTFDSTKKLILCCILKHNFKFPITKNQYFFSDDHIDSIDPNNLPVLFSLNDCPKSIKIQRKEGNKLISFNVNKKYDRKTNTRIYQIIPSLIIKNHLPCPISFNLYDSKNKKLNKKPIDLQFQNSIQINLFKHNIKSFHISICLNSNSYDKQRLINLDNEDEIYSSSENTAIKVHKTYKGEQKQIEIFTPYIIFNRTTEENPIKIKASESNSKSNSSLKIKDLAFYGLKSYTDKSHEIDVSLKNHFKVQKAVDLMKLNSNCSTIYLPKKVNSNFFYPLNCSITLGDFPMNDTHVVTFTDYLHVVNKLPFDFTLYPITSNKALSSNINDDEHETVLNEIIEAFAFKIPHQKNKKDDSHLINCLSKNATFVFSAENYSSKPIIQLNGINRTTFLLKKDENDELFYVELNIYEEKSTFYACFQLPNNPAPLTIKNSLNVPVWVHQNIKISKNKTKIEPNSSALFAFDEPFINNKQLYFEIDTKRITRSLENDNSNENENDNNNNDDEINNNNNNNENDNNNNSENDNSNNENNNNNNEIDDDDDDAAVDDGKKLFLFSIEDHLSPLISEENDFIISTSFINKNSKSIVIRSFKDQQILQSKLNFSVTIKSIHISLSNELQEFALFTLDEILATTQQDTENTYFHFFINSVQLDNQNSDEDVENNVFLYGTNKDITKGKGKSESKSFLNVYSIFSRGVPFFSVINFVSVQMQPIYIIPDPSIIFELESFFNKIFNSKLLSNNSIIEPSFNSVNVNKTLISYFEVSPIKIYISTPRDSTLLNLMIFNWFSSNSDLIISIPKLFTYKFNNNLSYLYDLLVNFYGNELLNQSFKNKFTRMILKMYAGMFFNFNEYKFIPLSTLQKENKRNQTDSCDNQSLIFNCFNEIELSKIANQIEKLFIKKPDVISQLIRKDSNMISIFDHFNDRFVFGIKNSKNSNQNDVDLIEIFKSNQIKKVRNPILSLIYSSVDVQNNEIIDRIREELFNEDNDQDIKFIIESNDKFYCVNCGYIYIMTANNENAHIDNFIGIDRITSISLTESKVEIKTNDPDLIQFEIQFEKEEFARMFVLYIKSKKNIYGIFNSYSAFA